MDLKKLLFLNVASGKSLIEKMATGNPVTFTTQIARTLKSLVVPLTYTQSGSGDPSMDNIRPISGISGFTCTHNETDLDIAFPDNVGTVYGGSLDLVSGVLTIDSVSATFKISDYTDKTVFSDMTFYDFKNVWNRLVVNNNHQVCSIAKYSWNGETRKDDHFYIYNASGSPRLMLYLVGTVDETQEFTVVSPLDTAITVQLTQNQIATVVGTNTISTNTSGNLNVTYFDKQ